MHLPSWPKENIDLRTKNYFRHTLSRQFFNIFQIIIIIYFKISVFYVFFLFCFYNNKIYVYFLTIYF